MAGALQAVYQNMRSFGGGGSFISATGGTVTTDGDFKVHTFNSSADFVVSAGGTISEVLQIAGGGGAGWSGGGGGGAGGYRTFSSVVIAPGTFGVVVGGGGSNSIGASTNGSDSSFNSNTSAGGGAGKSNADGNAGGSGGVREVFPMRIRVVRLLLRDKAMLAAALHKDLPTQAAAAAVRLLRAGRVVVANPARAVPVRQAAFLVLQ